MKLYRGDGDVVELPERLCSNRMVEEVGWESDMDPLQANRSNTLIPKRLQNRQSDLFHLFHNVPWSLGVLGRFHDAANRIHHDAGLVLVDEMTGSVDDLPLAAVGKLR